MNDNTTPSSLTVYQFAGLQTGPKLIVLGAVHGNETCGAVAIQKIRQDIEAGMLPIERGTLTLIPITNPFAYQNGRREGQRNLNRNMQVTATPQDFEDHVCNVLCPMLAAHDVLLDLHSFHTPGIPFAMIGPPNNDGELEAFARADEEEDFARSLGVHRFVEGWLDTYARGVYERQDRGVDANINYGMGTTETMRRMGGIGITLECGQHEDTAAPELAYAAICKALVHLGMSSSGAPSEPGSPHQVINMYRVVDRLHPDDQFCREWRSFEVVKQGDLIAHRKDGTGLFADQDGWIVFPNPSAQVDQEWFYLAKASSRLSID